MADPRVPSDTPVDVRIGADKCQEGKLRKAVEYTGTHCCLYEAERVRINGVEFFVPPEEKLEPCSCDSEDKLVFFCEKGFSCCF